MLITRRELDLHRIVVEKTYAPESLHFRGAEFRQSGPLKVSAVAELVGEDIRVRGAFKTSVEAICDRCLKPVTLPVNREFDLTYRPVSTIAREEEMEVPEDELDIGFYHGEGVQLTDILVEQIILEFPMKVICREDCRGLCPSCGADRNQGACSCAEPQSVSPFAALRGDQE